MRPAVAVAAFVLACGTASAAPDKYNVTPAEHAACDADAVSLCSAAFPDQDKLIVCMKAKRSSLSAACSAALASGLKKRHLNL